MSTWGLAVELMMDKMGLKSCDLTEVDMTISSVTIDSRGETVDILSLYFGDKGSVVDAEIVVVDAVVVVVIVLVVVLMVVPKVVVLVVVLEVMVDGLVGMLVVDEKVVGA